MKKQLEALEIYEAFAHHDEYEHEYEDESLHEHTHSHTHSHMQGSHTHTHQHTKAVLNRLSRAIGHLNSVKTMVENGRDCSEVLIQLAAVRSALDGISEVILQDHVEHCLRDAAETGDKQAFEELNQAIKLLIKKS